MQQNEIKMLFAFFKSAISGKPASDDALREYSPDSLPALIKVASKHDLAHLLAEGLKINGLMPDDPAAEKVIFKAIFRYERLKHEYDKICATLEKAEIPYMPLKGAIIREYYREPWLRTSSDIDILVRSDDLERAAVVLIQECEYHYDKLGPYDISLYSEIEIHVELHYNLLEDGRVNNCAQVLLDVWNVATKRNGYKYFYEMSNEMMFFYQLSHMAKHLSAGGCGIRSIIDLHTIEHTKVFNKELRDELLKQGGILCFAEAIEELSGVWFDEKEHTSLTLKLENYILEGGVYGDNKNHVAVQHAKKGGRLKYLMSRIVLPYDVIKLHYPILEAHRFLVPLMQVRRWCKLIFCGHLGRSTAEINYSFKITNDEVKDTVKLLDSIGLLQNKK